MQLLTLKGHRRGVWTVQFSPVDQCVLTGSGDATVRLWALTDGSCLKTFEGHSASVLRASFITYGTQVQHHATAHVASPSSTSPRATTAAAAIARAAVCAQLLYEE